VRSGGRHHDGARLVGQVGLDERRPVPPHARLLADREPREPAGHLTLADERPAAVTRDAVPRHLRVLERLARHGLDRIAPERRDTTYAFRDRHRIPPCGGALRRSPASSVADRIRRSASRVRPRHDAAYTAFGPEAALSSAGRFLNV